MAQLANIFRHVEILKAENDRTSKYHKKENVSYVGSNGSDHEFNIDYDDVEDNEVNVAELKPGPPYTCKVLRPSDLKNHVEPKNDKYVHKELSLLNYAVDKNETWNEIGLK